MHNHVILTGRLTHTPELRQTPSGVFVCKFSVAVQRKYNKNNGASKMASILFEKASDITFFIGNSVNEAHFGTVADSEMKTKAIEHLCRNLRAMGKEVREIYH